MTLRRQLFFGLSIVFLLICGSLLLVTVNATRDYLEQQLASHAQDTATALTRVLGEAMAKDDRVLAETQIAAVFDRGYFQQIAILSTGGARLVGRELPARIEGVPAWFTTLFPLKTPAGEAFLTAGWRQIGKIIVVSQPTIAYQHLWQNTVGMFWWIFGIYLLTLLATRILLRVILEPLLNIERTALAIGQKRFERIGDIPKARELQRVVVAMNDLSQRVAAILDEETARAERYRKEAYEDEVTHLDNRRSFYLRLSQVLQADYGYAGGVLIMLHLDGLDQYNTEYSYPRGDSLLAVIAHAAREALGERAAIMARMGGSTFAFLCLDLDKVECEALNKALQEKVNAVLVHSEAFHHVFYSIGVAYFHSGEAHSQILGRADLAMETARQSGQNMVRVLGDDLPVATSMGSYSWRMIIQSALEEERWVLLAQPVVNLADRSPMHHEVVARLLDAQGNLIPAAHFLPMAQRHQFMVRIDRALVTLTLGLLANAESDMGRLAVNVSAQGVADDDFLGWLSNQLRQLGPQAHRLAFEMTEFACTRDKEATQRFISLLREHGAQFGIDHFGLDPQSPNALRQFPPDYLKLDGGLVRELPHNEDSRMVLKAIVHLARSLDATVIAQHVEDEELVATLKENQVDGAQGYYFGKPERI
ncbi:diguanylate cyclase/phosphodiesterase [Sulfuritortus calidifontis]|uniref:Diguanylate cyclase/phosphodiesterase n=1 Tax=Sulfuritortus calidifontis TaxID=1914471 RepID=A0A4V2UQQ1_9PROT|nr:EAL domain-containing protein [Sulfuritortus calidifontis]TCS71922.1 diguanylate cyclase/phosphodiesterase [Sulfuritortus calidifontis]